MMTRKIRRDDPEYEKAMREAKELFDAAIATGAAKARGRPAASRGTGAAGPKAVGPNVPDKGVADLDDVEGLEDVDGIEDLDDGGDAAKGPPA